MRLLRNWFRPKDQIRPVCFSCKYANFFMQTSVQSILVSIFRIGLLRLSARTCEATASTATNVVCHLERFCFTFFQFSDVL